MSSFSISYGELSKLYINNNGNIADVLIYIQNNNANLTSVLINEIKKEIQKKFLAKFRIRWESSKREVEKFFNKNEEWLKSMHK